MEKNVADITQRITVLEDRVKRLDHILNGNGQPGLITRFERAITDLYRIMDRLNSIEEKEKSKHTDWQWIATAIIALAAIAVQFFRG